MNLVSCFFQVGLPDDGDDVYNRHVLPAGDSHRTGLEHLNLRNRAGRERRVNSEDDDDDEEEGGGRGGENISVHTDQKPGSSCCNRCDRSTKQGNACRLSTLFYGAVAIFGVHVVGGRSFVMLTLYLGPTEHSIYNAYGF